MSALYPSLDHVESAAIIKNAVMNADIEYEGIDYDRMCFYLLLNLGPMGMRKCGLEDCIPERIRNFSGESLNSKLNRDIINWRFSTGYGSEEKKLLIATMVHVATLVLMQTSCYSFAGHVYLSDVRSWHWFKSVSMCCQNSNGHMGLYVGKRSNELGTEGESIF